MLAVSVIGLPVYFVLFGARLRSRDQLSIVSVAMVLAAVLAGAIAFWLTRGPWH